MPDVICAMRLTAEIARLGPEHTGSRSRQESVQRFLGVVCQLGPAISGQYRESRFGSDSEQGWRSRKPGPDLARHSFRMIP